MCHLLQDKAVFETDTVTATLARFNNLAFTLRVTAGSGNPITSILFSLIEYSSKRVFCTHTRMHAAHMTNCYQVLF